jgi:hypothetical protein
MLAYNYGLQIRPTNTNKITDNWNSSFIGALAVGFGSSVSVSQTRQTLEAMCHAAVCSASN